MKVNRVFCYSKEVAKKNGNRLPVLELILSLVLGMVGLISFIIITIDKINSTIITLLLFAWMALLIYYGIVFILRSKSRMTGYATDTEGRIYKVMSMNNGQGLYFGGVAAGGMIDQLAKNNSRLGESLGGAIGAATELHSMNKSAKYMSNPEIIAKMVESAPNITGGEVLEILKVYSIVDRKKSVKIKCDYRILRTNLIRYNTNIIVEKSFNMFDDLISAFNTHR